MTPHSGTPCARQEFSSDFTLDVVNDVYDKIEEIVRLSAIGYFKAARELHKHSVEKHCGVLPIFAEFLRLLYDQGDFKTLLSTIAHDRDQRPS